MLDNLFIVDAHQDIAFHMDYFERGFKESSVPCMITLPWLKEGGVRLVFNTIFIHPKDKPDKTYESSMRQFSIYEKIYESYGEDVIQVKDSHDLRRLRENSKIGFLTMMEGADPIEEPGKLREFYERGVRILAPAWNNRNRYASGNETRAGITEEGRELIGRMNQMRIILDLSHLNERCFWDALETCKTVPIATHSNVRSLTDHPRNLNDEQLLAISERGGVIGIVLFNKFLKMGDGKPTLEEVFAHTDYVVSLCGEDHVGIGSDLDGADINDFPKGIRTASDLPKIGEFFLEKGYSEERVRKIMGGNFLRVLEEGLPT